MKTRILWMVVLLLSISIASVAVAQNAAVTHDTWSSGAPMPRALVSSAAAVFGKYIVVVGGAYGWSNVAIADTRIYDPASNTWRRGPSLPTPISGAAAAVANGLFYVIGGGDRNMYTNAVWAYDLQTRTWSSKSPMPTARGNFVAVVEKNIIYAIGGFNGSTTVNNVESYNPATDTWTEETPLPAGVLGLAAGLMKGWIVAADGNEGACGGCDYGQTQIYSPSSNAWYGGSSDPTPRDWVCGGSIDGQLYVASGYPADGYAGGESYTLTESFNAKSNTWATLADIPQGTIGAASAVYNGQLYCFGGAPSYPGGAALNNVQIYQP